MGSTSHILLLSTPQESGTPTGTVVVNSRDRSGTIIARPIWDHIPTTTGAAPNPAAATVLPFQTTTTRTRRLRHHRELPPESPSDTSRPDTETEDDGDIDMDRMDLEEEEEEEEDSGRMDSDVPSASASVSASSSPERPEIHQLQSRHHHHRHHLALHAHTHNRGRRAVGIVSDEPTNGPQTLQVDGGDAHIIINEAGGGVGGVEMGVGVGPVRVGDVGVGVEVRARPALECPTPGAGPVIPAATTPATSPTTATNATFPTRTSNASTSHTPPHHTASDSGPYRDEDVLLSLQLLVYLSKYPYVRQAFYKPRVMFHPASAELGGQRFGIGSGEGKEKGRKEKEKKGEKGLEKEKEKEKGVPPSTTTKETPGSSFKALANVSSFHSNTGAATSSRGKELNAFTSSTSSTLTVMAQLDPSSSTLTSSVTSKPTPPSSSIPSSTSPRQTNIFPLVERFTFKPSSTETDLPNPPPRLPPEIRYWAGVIMRNACRKDDGIRQCANGEVFFFFVLLLIGVDGLDVS